MQVSPNPPLSEVVAIGASVLVGVTLFHGFCLLYIHRNYRRFAKRLLEKGSHPFLASIIFGWAVFLMLILHCIDTGIWSTILHTLGLVPDLRTSVYMAASDYTTLGLADVHLGSGWRELNPIIAISGLFTFGWTTSIMFNVVGFHINLTEQLAASK